MLRVTLLFLFALAASFAASPDDAVREAERSFGASVASRDVAALERLLAADLTYGHSTGNADDKKSYIEGVKAGKTDYSNFVYDDAMQVRIYGNTAVVNASASFGPESNRLHLKFLHVYVKKDGRWQLVAHQSVRLSS